MFFEQKNTLYGGLRIIEAVSSLTLCLSDGDQIMPQGIMQNSPGDASRHHQGVKGFNLYYKAKWVIFISKDRCITFRKFILNFFLKCKVFR